MMQKSLEVEVFTQERVSYEFTREGLRKHVLSFLDEDSYCDETLYAICEEFNYRLGIKSQNLAELLEHWGTNFSWSINFGIVSYTPKDAWDNYYYKSKTGKSYKGLDALLSS